MKNCFLLVKTVNWGSYSKTFLTPLRWRGDPQFFIIEDWSHYRERGEMPSYIAVTLSWSVVIAYHLDPWCIVQQDLNGLFLWAAIDLCTRMGRKSLARKGHIQNSLSSQATRLTLTLHISEIGSLTLLAVCKHKELVLELLIRMLRQKTSLCFSDSNVSVIFLKVSPWKFQCNSEMINIQHLRELFCIYHHCPHQHIRSLSRD